MRQRTALINDEVVSEVGFFEEAWKMATEKDKRDLFRIFIHRIIWNEDRTEKGKAEMKIYLYARLVEEICVIRQNL